MTILPDWLTRQAKQQCNKHAILSGTVSWTFGDLDAQANLYAGRLASAGITAEDRVAVLSHNSLAFVAIIHALTKLDAVLVPLNIRLTDSEAAWQIVDSDARLLLCDASLVDKALVILASLSDVRLFTIGDSEDPKIPAIEALESQVVTAHSLIDLDATQAIIYTSGTTGRPKGARVTYGMQWWSAIGSAINLGHDPEDIWLDTLPLFHISGLSILWRSVINGISVALFERFDPVQVNAAISRERITIISVVAVMLQRMLAAQDNAYPSWLRCVLIGGGPVSPSLLESCASRDIPVVQTYGMTESCAQAVTLSPGDALRKLGSAGRPLAAVQLRIHGENGDASPNESGEIWLRGPTITPGYYHQPEATANAFEDGWFKTGDIGYLDDEGYLFVLDRRVDLIISGGENIYPAEVEAALLSHPAVVEAGVRGQNDPVWGQVPVAYVHLHDDVSVTLPELLAHVTARVAPYKVPKAIHFVGPLPRNAAGKLLRRLLGGD
jgi:o-succinylbenzoate---CoA ligase